MTPNLKHISEKLDEILRRLPVPAATQEQPAGSRATASDMLNVTELAEHITYKIQSLLTDKYTNSFRIACGVIGQELQKAVNSMPHDALVGEAFYCEAQRNPSTEEVPMPNPVMPDPFKHQSGEHGADLQSTSVTTGSPRKVGEDGAQVTLETVFDEERQDGEWRNAVAEQLNTLLTRAKYCADTTNDESDKEVELATLATDQ